MQRGFKAEAERQAQHIRSSMGLRPVDKLDSLSLARHLGAEVRSAEELTNLQKLKTLEEIQPGAFSACTFILVDRTVIVYSPLASLGRRQSDVAHEVAHLILKHSVKDIQKVGELPFFTCNPDEEQEANWLAGCLLLPRSLLLTAAKQGLDARRLAEKYEVSEQMANFRLRTTGVLRQIKSPTSST